MAYQIKKFSRKHQEIMLWFLLHPGATLTEASSDLGYTVGWLSQICNSDLFQAELAKIQTEEIQLGPLGLLEKQKAVAYQGLEILSEKLDLEGNVATVGDITTKLLKLLQPSVAPELHIGNNAQVVIATQEGLASAQQILQEVRALRPPLRPTDDLGRSAKGEVIDNGRVIDAPPS